MIIVMSKIKVTNGNDDGLAAQYMQRSGLVDGQPGFIDMQVLRNQDDPCEFIVYMRWQDRASFDAYYKQADFRAAHRNVAAIPGGVKIDRTSKLLAVYDVVTS